MQKLTTLLLLGLFSSLVQAQQNFDLIKSINAVKKNQIISDIARIQYFENSIPTYKGSANYELISNLNLFFKNPFDKEIKDFNLLKSLEAVKDIIIITPQYPSSSSNEVVETGGQSGADGDGIIDRYEFLDNQIELMGSLEAVVPTGASLSTKVIDALSKFLVDRTKQELTLTFYENFKDNLNQPYKIKIKDTITLTLYMKDIFPNTYLLFESRNYFESPSLGETWLISFQKDLSKLPYKLEEIMHKNNTLNAVDEFRFAAVSYDLFKKIKSGKHPLLVLEELNEQYNIDKEYTYEINQLLGVLQLFSENLVKEQVIEDFKETNWITNFDWEALTQEQRKYLTGLIYQMGRSNELFSKIIVQGRPIEDLITASNYKILETFIKRTVSNFTTINAKLAQVKNSSEENKFKNYLTFLESFYNVFEETQENFYTITGRSAAYYQSDYYVKYKPLIADILEFNKAANDARYAECLLITIRYLNNLIPELEQNNEVVKKLTFYGNFMVDVLNTSENDGDLKNVIEKYAMPVSSYRIKRKFHSSWDVNAYPGLNAGYEFSNSNSLSYGITAPIGISYSFKNHYNAASNNPSSSSTLFLSVIDIGAPFSYRFTNDEAEGLPENIKWEQVFSPGFFYIYGFKESPLSLGLSLQYTPLLRKINTNNILDEKNVLRMGVSVLVDIPLYNLKSKEFSNKDVKARVSVRNQ